MLQEDVQSLPADVKKVLIAVAMALGNKPVLPETLVAVAGQYVNSLEGHIVHISHRPRPPKGAKPRLKAAYRLAIAGPRLDGQWHFSPGQLGDLLRDLRNETEITKSTSLE